MIRRPQINQIITIRPLIYPHMSSPNPLKLFRKSHIRLHLITRSTTNNDKLPRKIQINPPRRSRHFRRHQFQTRKSYIHIILCFRFITHLHLPHTRSNHLPHCLWLFHNLFPHSYLPSSSQFLTYNHSILFLFKKPTPKYTLRFLFLLFLLLLFFFFLLFLFLFPVPKKHIHNLIILIFIRH